MRFPVDEADDSVEPHEQIARLEGHIEQLAEKIESCRKFILASQLAIAFGGIVLLALMFGLIRPDATALGASIAAVLGGIVMLGSNSSTAKDAESQMAAAEAQRAALIGMVDLRVVSERAATPTLH